MNGYIIAISILSVLVVVFGFTTFNLLRKNEKAEDIVLGYLVYLDKISRIIEISSDRLKKVDYKGSFESDDEVGFFFQQLKYLQEQLNNFKVK